MLGFKTKKVTFGQDCLRNEDESGCLTGYSVLASWSITPADLGIPPDMPAIMPAWNSDHGDVMNDEHAFLQEMQEKPDDTSLRLVFADWLKERGDPRGELIRLLHTLTQSIEVPEREKLEDRLRSLVASGVQPVGPFFTNSIGTKFAWIPAGTFLMGSPPGGRPYQENETQHEVTLTKGYYLAVSPVTRRQFARFVQATGYKSEIDPEVDEPNWRTPGFDQADDHPVVFVTWNDAVAFCQWLSEQDARNYRLPTEAEWEYACRAGTTTPFYFGNTISADLANYNRNLETTTPSSKYRPNGWGLYDMHGNVDEWCADWEADYPAGKVVDPQGEQSGHNRMLRGGNFRSPPGIVRSASRGGGEPTFCVPYVGFRVALTFLP